MNFDNFPTVNEYYDGAAKKYAIKINDDIYMVKYPTKTDIKNDLNTEYSNSSFSEYVSCHIINALKIPGVEAQETLLGEKNGKIVVACKDFTNPYLKLVKFNMIQNADISSELSGRHPVLDDVLQTYKTLPQLQAPQFIERFWDTFAVDALLGNFDRHSGNWGFLNDLKTDTLTPAPIYDCGSCLYPALSKNRMGDIISSPEEIEKRIFEFPRSAFVDKKTKNKISYADYIKGSSDVSLKKSLDKIAQVMNFDIIHDVLEQTPYLSDEQKAFYNTIIQKRYENLIEPFVVKRQHRMINPIQEYCKNKDMQRNEILSKDLEIER